jgi:hypothetical protein
MDKRMSKGYEIAQRQQVSIAEGGWIVKSQSTNWIYKVSNTFICDCQDSEQHNMTCKHADAVRYYLGIEKHRPRG